QLSGNTLAGSGQDTIPPGSAFGDIRLRQRQDTTVHLPGYAGGPTDTNAVAAFIQNINPGPETVLVSANSPPGGGFVGGTLPLLAAEGGVLTQAVGSLDAAIASPIDIGVLPAGQTVTIQ